MNISRRWLEGFLHRELDPHDAAERLTLLGAAVDGITPRFADLADVVVALVENVAPHPNADRLRVCTVNDGRDARWNVVCGAPNVTAGHRYPFARIGTTLPGGLTIAKRKLRGEVSEGMLCSGRELGLSDDHDGLYTLQVDAAPGTPLLEALPLRDDCFDLDIGPNRPDLLGHKGVARELAASYKVPFRLPTIPGSRIAEIPNAVRADGVEGVTGGLRVAIDDPNGCARFLGAVVRGVQVGPSPEWLVGPLRSIGLRSINNVVDATNYVLHELGQPMHAYDLATLRGGRIAARAAKDGESLTTLDGVSRTLGAGQTVIADGERVVGVAGVMGGEDTEVRSGTTEIFLECAWFSPTATRATRKALGLSTDASQRFERGTDLWGAADALRRCLELILTSAGGTVADAPVDVWPTPTHPPRIFLRLARVAQIVGVELSLREVEAALVAIGATVVAKPADGRIAVDVPGWRPDLVEEIDLVEEVARVHGYQNVPSELRPYRVGHRVDAVEWTAAARVREGLVRLGLMETVSLPMGPDAEGVPLENPLSADHGYLRSSLLPGLVRQVQGNWDGQSRDIRLFEIGIAFADAGRGNLPGESLRVGAVVTGWREPAHWSASAHGVDLDRWDLKGLFESAAALAYPDATVQVEGDSWVALAPDGTRVGSAGLLEADGPPWAGDLYGFEIMIGSAPRAPVAFRPWPVTPASDRDLALLVPLGVTAAQVIDTITAAGEGASLESVHVVDEFRGAGLPAGTRSVAFRLVFRAPDRTLRDNEIERAVEKILRALEDTLGVTLRTA